MSTATVQEPVPASTTQFIGDDKLYEIIDGQRVGLPPMGINASLIASSIFGFLWVHARSNVLGHAVCDGLFHLPLPADRNRRPDVAFVSYDRWPKARPLPERDNAWDVLPNLVVE